MPASTELNTQSLLKKIYAQVGIKQTYNPDSNVTAWAVIVADTNIEISIAKNKDCGDGIFEVLPYAGGEIQLQKCHGYIFPQWFTQSEIEDIVPKLVKAFISGIQFTYPSENT